MRTERLLVGLAGSYVPEFSRNRQTRRLLELSGHTVISSHADIWVGDRVRLAAIGKWHAAARALIAYPLLLWRLLRAPTPDLYLVGYPGWFDVPVVKLVAALRRRPVVFDMFISLYDTAIRDRGMFSERSLVARISRAADKWACRLANLVILDTPAHAEYVATLTGVPTDRFGVVWLGADDERFQPRVDTEPGEPYVLFHGTFVPLQGVGTIIRAAKRLEADQITVRIVGDGQEREYVDEVMDELRPLNVDMTGLLPLAEIPGQIAGATVCLGIFGESEKAQRVIPNKLFECVAMKKAVVTADTPGVRSGFSAGEVIMVPSGDSEKLADAVRALVRDKARRDEIARAGFERYRSDYAPKKLAETMDDLLRRVVQSRLEGS